MKLINQVSQFHSLRPTLLSLIYILGNSQHTIEMIAVKGCSVADATSNESLTDTAFGPDKAFSGLLVTCTVHNCRKLTL